VSWTTDTTRKVVLRAAAGHEHKGVRRKDGGTGFLQEHSTTPWTLNIPNIEFIDLEIGTSGDWYVFWGGVSPTLIDRCIIANEAATNTSAISDDNRSVAFTIRNCLIITSKWGISVFTGGTLSIIENCTVITPTGSGQNGIYGGTATNCVAHNFFDNCMIPSAQSYCASTDGTASGTGAVTGVVDADFVDFANGDYKPATAGKLDGAGTDLSGTFTVDITGATRTQWDIGAYGIVAAGGVTFDGPNIIDQPQGVLNEVFVFDENGEGTVASRFSVT
jgi:hypothetical protein